MASGSLLLLLLSASPAPFHHPPEPGRPPQEQTGNNLPANDWVLDQTTGNVEFYHKLVTCQGKKVVLLKLNNKNAYSVKVSWKEVFTTQMEQQAEGHFGRKELVVAPGEVAAADCTGNHPRALMILPAGVSPAYEANIQKFSYKDILVTKDIPVTKN